MGGARWHAAGWCFLLPRVQLSRTVLLAIAGLCSMLESTVGWLFYMGARLAGCVANLKGFADIKAEDQQLIRDKVCESPLQAACAAGEGWMCGGGSGQAVRGAGWVDR